MFYHSVTEKTLGVMDIDCPDCGHPTNMKVVSRKELMVAVVVPIWVTRYYVTCGGCWNTFKVDKEIIGDLAKRK